MRLKRKMYLLNRNFETIVNEHGVRVPNGTISKTGEHTIIDPTVWEYRILYLLEEEIKRVSMGKNMLFFFAGWFSVAIGFEVAPIYGNIAGAVSFLLLTLIFSKRESTPTWRALVGYNEPPAEVIPPKRVPPAPPSTKNRQPTTQTRNR